MNVWKKYRVKTAPEHLKDHTQFSFNSVSFQINFSSQMFGQQTLASGLFRGAHSPPRHHPACVSPCMAAVVGRGLFYPSIKSPPGGFRSAQIWFGLAWPKQQMFYVLMCFVALCCAWPITVHTTQNISLRDEDFRKQNSAFLLLYTCKECRRTFSLMWTKNWWGYFSVKIFYTK